MAVAAEQLRTRIADLLDTGDYTWARATLEGIAETLETQVVATEGQKRAVDNIEEGGQRGARRSRR